MPYALLMYGDEAHGETPTAMPPEQGCAVGRVLERAGRRRACARLECPDAHRNREHAAQAERAVRSSPTGRSRRRRSSLGGLIVIECADLEAALAFAATVPCAPHGSIEVRAVAESC